MDLVATGVGFVLGVVGTAIGAMIAAMIGGHFRDVELRAAVATEIDENIARLGSENVGPEQINRSAWEAARGVSWKRAARETLTAAYAEGERVNAWVAMTNAHLATPGRTATDQEMFSSFSLKTAERARAKFEAARKLFPD